jgi:hypothetical protein
MMTNPRKVEPISKRPRQSADVRPNQAFGVIFIDEKVANLNNENVTLCFRYPAASPGVNVIKLFFDSSLRSQQFKLEGLSLSSF